MKLEIGDNSLSVSGELMAGEEHTVNTEAEAIFDMMEELQDGVFWDVGAYAGIWAICADSVTSELVYAFEPHPGIFEQLVKNLSENDSDAVPVQKALSDTEGVAILNTERKYHTTGTLAYEGEGVEVETVVADDISRYGAIKKPDVMKIDVEGFELDLIESMDEVLEKCRVIYCEVHVPEDGGDEYREKIFAALVKRGYAIEIIWTRDSGLNDYVEMVKARKSNV